jgi:hypothetical protein
MYPSAFTQKGSNMALSKKKRTGKTTISASVFRKTASGRKRRKSDGTQPSKDALAAKAAAKAAAAA